ncbi:MFS transporter [Granulicella sibirica]|uniref:Putative transporter n=1 Tax=Granulicella sibirica TaxID=2479048 RepID=A0A4Q0SZQ0_9BACT|nr:MFS transporter [Granulicella sibirica]RXH54711.1 putative transporter [Granulicella sibirica]
MAVPETSKPSLEDLDPDFRGVGISPVPRQRFEQYSHAWRALRYRNFRLLFIGQGISLIGSWVTRVATSWLVYKLTHSALLLGWIGFTTAMPVFLLSPLAGVWVDKVHDKRRLTAITQVILALTSFALAGLALSRHVTIAEIFLLNTVKGVANAFDMPARQTFVTRTVDNREVLGNAIALNSSIVNIARLLGPSIAGAIMAFSSEGWCFLIDGISYIAVLWSLFAMHFTPGERVAQRPVSVVQQMRQGWTYVAGTVPFRNILTLFAILSLLGIPYTILMPIFASTVLHGGPQTLGLLLGAPGVGALLSGLSLALRKSSVGLVRSVALSSTLFGLALVAFGFSHQLYLSLILLFFVGFGMMQSMAASSTILQTLTDEDMRGRVMSYYIMAMTGMLPFGTLLAGWIAHRYTAAIAVIFSGFAVLLATAWFWSQYRTTQENAKSMMRNLGLLPSDRVSV